MWFSKKGNLIFFLNRRCKVGCASCNVGASPDNIEELSVQWLEALFERMGNLEFSGYIIWTGGEPFLSFEALKKGISLASQRGFHSEILTSGTWFENHPENLKSLAGAGNFSIRISLDAEHQDRVPMPMIISLIKKALELDIEVNFTFRKIPERCESVSVNDYLEEIITELPEFYDRNHTRSRWLHYIPHIPISSEETHASSRCFSGSISKRPKWRQPCKMGFKDIVIGADGMVYPCCGLFSIPEYERLAVGDPVKETWETLETRQLNDPLFRVLREKGPYGICRELGMEPETWDWPAYESPCHLCLALFRLHEERVFRHFSQSTLCSQRGTKSGKNF
jgi:MoaA/NifB/PqqE/SkfB family radical SAM enzyme